MSKNKEHEATATRFKEFAGRYKLWIGIGAVALVALIVFGYINYTIAVRNEGERKEQDLTALYSQSMNSLSTCLDQGDVAAQVTKAEYDSIKDILVETAAARYVDANGQPTDASGVLGGGQLISMLQENYPQIDQRSWQNLQTLVIGCREEFQGKQDQIQAFAADYNQWRVSDNLLNSWIKADFPSDELKVVTADGTSLYGRAAYDRITRVVATSAAIDAFESGTLESQDLFGNNKK